MRIYIDLDDVLCDTAGAYLELLDKEFGRQVAFDEIFSFNLQQSFGLDDADNQRMFELAHRDDFTMNLRPIDGMAEVIGSWWEQGNTIEIVTGRHTSAHPATLEWLDEHRIRYHSFTMVDKYGWRDTDHELAISMTELAGQVFDVGIEDSPKMAAYLAENLRVPVLLFDRPWNRSFQHAGKWNRCRSWSEIANQVDRLAGESSRHG